MASVLNCTARNGVRVSQEGSNAVFEAGPLGVIAGGGTKNILATDNGKIITNEGEVGAASARPKNLPPAAAGLKNYFYDQAGTGIRIVADVGDTIRFGGTVSAPAGHIESIGAGQLLILIAVNATEWVALPTPDIWEIDN